MLRWGYKEGQDLKGKHQGRIFSKIPPPNGGGKFYPENCLRLNIAGKMGKNRHKWGKIGCK